MARPRLGPAVDPELRTRLRARAEVQGRYSRNCGDPADANEWAAIAAAMDRGEAVTVYAQRLGADRDGLPGLDDRALVRVGSDGRVAALGPASADPDRPIR